MKRLGIFNSYKDHAWLKKVYGRLSQNDILMAVEFIGLNDELNKLDFEFKINRMFLDKQRPKNYKEILELLTCANSALPN